VVKENRASFSVINEKKKAKKKSYNNSGVINFEWIRIEEEKTFLDYIQSGVQLHFTVAVDFTASNGNNSGLFCTTRNVPKSVLMKFQLVLGDPNNPQSLHYRHPQMDNQYSLAIKSVGECKGTTHCNLEANK
jgi:hypothetical protein